MANNNITQNNSFDDCQSHGYKCDSCGKEMPWTDEEAEKLERPKPGTRQEDWDYYIPCPLCKTGSVMQPTLSLEDALESIFNCE